MNFLFTILPVLSNQLHDIALLSLLFNEPPSRHTAMAVRQQLKGGINPKNVPYLRYDALVLVPRLAPSLLCQTYFPKRASAILWYNYRERPTNNHSNNI